MARNEEPNRLNDVFDHSKEGLKSAGITKKEFKKALDMVNETCCGMETPEKSLEHWCHFLTKKEMALLIKKFKHDPIEEELNKRIRRMIDDEEVPRPTKEEKNSEKPNRFNNLYDHEKETVEECIGFNQEEFMENGVRICEKITEEMIMGDKKTSQIIEYIQKHTTHKEAAMLFAAEFKNRTLGNPAAKIAELMRMMRRMGGNDD